METKVIIVCWNDNSVVYLASNAVGVNPIRMVKRYSQKENKSILIPQPYIIQLYNQNMGGVDTSDQNIALYQTGIRGKKWYFCLFAHVSTWRYKTHGSSAEFLIKKSRLDHLAFRRRISKRSYIFTSGE